MNPLLVAFLMSLARAGLAWFAGYLTKGKIISETEAGQYIEAASGWLVISALTAAPVIWSGVKTRMEQRQHDHEIKVAIKGPSDATVEEVKEKAKV